MMLNPGLEPNVNQNQFMLKAFEDSGFGSAFSTRFRKGYASWVDFGNFKEREVKNGSRFTGTLNDDHFWSTGVDGIKFGKDSKDAYKWSNTPQGVF